MIIGTRGSKLALAQANLVAGLLQGQGVEAELKIIKTSGDTFQDRPLHEVSGVGAFVREIDERLLAGEIDLAVHSMKDVPTIRPPGLVNAAILKRDSPLDVLITRNGEKITDLPPGAVIGTTSMRRRAQLLRFRPDLIVKDLRGNIDTRLRKLREGQYDGIILAEAGLERMNWDLPREQLKPPDFIPSANQGTIVLVTKKDAPTEKIAKQLDHSPTRIEIMVEREIITILGGGCIVPIGAYARTTKDTIKVTAEVLSLDGKKYVKIEEEIPREDWQENARKLGKKLRDNGGSELVAEAVETLKS